MPDTPVAASASRGRLDRGAGQCRERACATRRSATPALGLASYQEGELHRLVGEFDLAERDYRQAGRSGHDPMPGFALLQLARGDAVSAAAAIQRALHEHGPGGRPALLSAAVEIYRATGDFVAARAAADELSAISARSTSAVLRAMAARQWGRRLSPPASWLPHWPSCGPPSALGGRCTCRTKRLARFCCWAWRAPRSATGRVRKWSSTAPEMVSPRWRRTGSRACGYAAGRPRRRRRQKR